ncbi:3-isopropylmalate dehydratase small subunit [Polymorphobacter multimanifer]|uniref:3-isopropylmalate dehydratase small subunit n=1 Tax=Polymorphobacter multimanifer TaxID=1070431 RepID=A0A841L5W1_9SPHN|nr:3-isopropylmalate dehydratase small subunit [Polymorphobacter multimanifer]MBB6227987.1 3-isopropylmalate/(R)-2-methylmalate dehydratase small subunit [Polymorphobacter multimanifer]GGI84187.1 3-isopropylmalate dehydratase small subunit [Polymorphobacter multimanifer]
MSTPFVTLTGVAAPMIEDNIDTDIIIPSREMKSTGKTGLADGLFAGRRYREGREPDPGFVLNRPDFAQAAILLAGDNFGCGSSREHAVWALVEWGIRCVIAPSFSPIFAGNAVRGGLLPCVLPRAAVQALAGVGAVTVDLPAQTLVAGELSFGFSIDGEAKAMLLGGLDAIDLTLVQADAIRAFQAFDRQQRPWVYLAQGTDEGSACYDDAIDSKGRIP